MISLKRRALVLGMAGIMAFSLAACAKNESETQASQSEATAQVTEATQATEDTKASEEQQANAQTGAFAFNINGYDLKIGDVYDDVKDKLGQEIKPAEDIGACDPQGRSDFNHFYDGVDVTVHFDGKVTRMYADVDNKGAATISGIAIGDNADKIKTALGNPEMEDETSIVYMNDQYILSFTLENGSITMIDFSDANA